MDEDATTSDSSAAETFDPVRFSPQPQPTLLPPLIFSFGRNSCYATSLSDDALLGFEQDLIHAIFKLVWRRRAGKGGGGGNEDIDAEVIHWTPVT
jgi:hypothetical protein